MDPAKPMASQIGNSPAQLSSPALDPLGIAQSRGGAKPIAAELQAPSGADPDLATNDQNASTGDGSQDKSSVNVAGERAQELAQKLVDDVLKPHVKLEVSRSESSGNFTYRTIDDRTGEVLREWPQEQLVEELGDEDALSALFVDRSV